MAYGQCAPSCDPLTEKVSIILIFYLKICIERHWKGENRNPKSFHIIHITWLF